MKSENSIQAKFRKLWIYYILQSLLAAAALLIIILILGRERMVVASAIGATAFIVFAMPKSASAKTRNVIGGHIVGIIAGSIFLTVALPFSIECALAVALAIFLMVAMDVEHPPAAGTALAVVINEVSLDAFVTILASALILSQCRYYLRHYLKDLV
ncbi:MAG: HPP family protein [Sedimentisphaerales bacterium]|nr:HPP family protein [Sedimentisphaerales bacterium]